MNKVYFFIFFELILLCCVTENYCQSRIDSIALSHLNNISHGDSAFYKIEKKGNTKTILSNFYVHFISKIITDSIRIEMYKFGMSESHSPVFFLVTITKGLLCNIKIIDSLSVEVDIESLLKFLRPYNLTELQKAKLIKQMMTIY